MSEYKLVPVEPTDEMVSAAEDAYMPFGDMDIALRMAVLAAPAVQGEPAAITDADILAIAGRVESCPVSPWWLKDDVAIGDVRAAVLRFARALLDAAPQPAPDVSALVEELVEALELARIDLKEWLKSFPNAPREPTGKIIERIDAALAAHRKGGDQA